jgi:hypothetical protein
MTVRSRTRKVLGDVAVALLLSGMIAGLCLALVLIAPFELVPPRVR